LYLGCMHVHASRCAARKAFLQLSHLQSCLSRMYKKSSSDGHDAMRLLLL